MIALMLMVEAAAQDARHALSSARCEALLAGVARGEPQAFEALYRGTDRMLFAYALSLTRNHDDAQDAMMETYLKIRAGAHLYQPRGKPLAWIFTITKNIVRSQQRAAAREISLEDGPELSFDSGEQALDSLVLRAALGVLPEQERQIVLLHAVSGMKHRELAQLLELPLSTVLSKYARALSKLKKYLAEQGEGAAYPWKK